MTDYLAEARRIVDDLPSDPMLRLAAVRTVQALATIAVAEALTAHTPPQGSGEPRPEMDAAKTPAPAESCALACSCGECHHGDVPHEPSLVALDAAETLAGEVRRWRAADRLFPPESAEWWDATLRFRDVADRIGAAS